MIQMDGGDRLRVTLLDRMSTVENNRTSITGLTLEAILMAEKNATSSQPQAINTPSRNQTLVDVMQSEHRHNNNNSRDKTAWKSLREKLRLKRNATVWISSNSNNNNNNNNSPIPSLDTPILNNDSHRQRLGFLLSNSPPLSSSSTGAMVEGRLRLGAVLAEERALSAREEEIPVEVQPARMSLMELLVENEGQVSLVGGGEEEESVVCGNEASEETAVEMRSCCVCMVRSKGAAFIPCGHTFCRLCSRELWVQRGNCPLCNTSILEILDLF